MTFTIKNDKGEDIAETFAELQYVRVLEATVSNIQTDFENIKEDIGCQLTNIVNEINDIKSSIKELERHLIKLQQSQITKNSNFFKNIISAMVGTKETRIKTSTVTIEEKQ